MPTSFRRLGHAPERRATGGTPRVEAPMRLLPRDGARLPIAASEEAA
ncbi:MAG: hypothetical protein HOY69_01025 [Streptomyces sp.]|nr:hypothetical protein [Streptomyces sp.]